MSHMFVLTLTGTDRVGIVEEVTGMLLELGGNVGTSRMARLGGEFAILMLVSLPDDQAAGLQGVVEKLVAQGYQLTTKQTVNRYAELHPDWLPYQIEVLGADHEGIIHEVARHLSQRGISIETMDTETSRAPVSGAPLFSMKAQIVVPPELQQLDWQETLQNVGKDLNLDIQIMPGKKS